MLEITIDNCYKCDLEFLYLFDLLDTILTDKTLMSSKDKKEKLKEENKMKNENWKMKNENKMKNEKWKMKNEKWK